MPNLTFGPKSDGREFISDRARNFRSSQEELFYLRKCVRDKELELDAPKNRFESDRIAKRVISEYASIPSASILHEAVAMPEHEMLGRALKLEPERRDKQIDELLRIVAVHGIRNALSVVARMKNPRLQDDLIRLLVRCVAEGLPKNGIFSMANMQRALHVAFFEIKPSVEDVQDREQRQNLAYIFASSEHLYEGLLSLISRHESFSLEIAVPDGRDEVYIYLTVPSAKRALAERLIMNLLPSARISENRGDYDIFNHTGEIAGAVARPANHPAFSLNTYETLGLNSQNALLSAFTKIAKYGEGAAIQFVVGTEGDRYNMHFKKILREMEKEQPISKALHVQETALGDIVDGVLKSMLSRQRDGERGESGDAANQIARESIGRKTKSRIAPVVIRLAASAADKKRAGDILDGLTASFAQYGDPKSNHLVFKKVGSWDAREFLRDFTMRTLNPSFVVPLSLNELATMLPFAAQ